jgi:prolyl-tRNA editing enzyme YbaK/EbsC (Cys-tRNA(Pro) deacylase)
MGAGDQQARKQTGLERFRERMAAQGLEIDVREMGDSTHTAEEAARAVGCDVAQIVKSLVFEADGAPLLVLTSGPVRVDTELVGAAIGAVVGKADARAVKQVTGYSIGGVPPLAHDTAVRTLMDETLLSQPELWAAAGSATAVFRIAPAELALLTGAEVLRVG